MIDVTEYYAKRVEVYSGELIKVEKRIRKISLLRLGCLLMAGTGLYFGFNGTWAGFIWSTVFFIGFLYLIKRHSIAFLEKNRIAALLLLNQKEVAFQSGDKSVFDTGLDFDTSKHLYALDLDIFGIGSLFQSVGRTATLSGKVLLGNALLNPLTREDEIVRRREAIRDLTPDVEWRQAFYVLGQQTEEKPSDREQISSWLSLPEFFEGRRGWKVVTVMMSVLSAVIIVYCIVTAQFLTQLLFVPIIINGLLMIFISKSIKEYFGYFGRKTKQFKKYADLFVHINKGTFSSAESVELQRKCLEASAAFKKLFELSSLADQRGNMMVATFMNGFFLFDLWIIYRIEGWRRINRNSINQWIDSLVTIDMISSFANFSFNHPDFVDASVRTGSPFISAKALAHPLMNTSSSIKNDYEVGVTTRLHVITGSNMAGKSTFIRAVGLNTVLACNGVSVCASEFSCSVLGIITSIRITDSLEENASYFKAELNRLSQLKGNLETNSPFIVLLDEILRGTNSDDKRLGTQSFLLKLKQYNCIVLLATHDLSIGKLEQEFPGIVENYCFESQFSGDGLLFDYKLRRGISASTNATFLMKRMGLID
ncbi:MutS family DNA mismatch repair protein [soil metagenome]